MSKAETLPSFEEIKALHRKYAPTETVFDLVFTHCRIVSDIASQLEQKSKIEANMELVQAGCLLHDIGVYPLFNAAGIETDPKNYVSHGIRGEEILKQEGFSEKLQRFASHHTGSGITEQEIIARNLPLPHRDFLAENVEEELVMYADKFHSKINPPTFNSYDFYADHIKQFGENATVSFDRLTRKFGKPDLDDLIAQYGHALRNKVA